MFSLPFTLNRDLLTLRDIPRRGLATLLCAWVLSVSMIPSAFAKEPAAPAKDTSARTRVAYVLERAVDAEALQRTLADTTPETKALLAGFDQDLASLYPRKNAAAMGLLVSLGDQGTAHAARRLMDGHANRPEERARLLQVLSANKASFVETLLHQALREPRPSLRMVAASSLAHFDTVASARALAPLARDAIAGVRAAAMRSLFAMSNQEALRIRTSLPRDTELDLLARRLVLHAQRGDASDHLHAIAWDALTQGDPTCPDLLDLRINAAHYLTMPRTNVPSARLQDVMPHVTTLERHVNSMEPLDAVSVPKQTPAERRRVSLRETLVRGACTLLDRKDLSADARSALIDTCVGWAAKPCRMNPFVRNPIPEHRLRQRLPDEGERIAKPVMAHLRHQTYADPREGVLLIQSLEPHVALRYLHEVLSWNEGASSNSTSTSKEYLRFVRVAASSGIRGLGTVGDEARAAKLIFEEPNRTVRTDILQTLGAEPASWAVNMLERACGASDAAMRRIAREVLARRKEPRAFDILAAQYFEHPTEYGDQHLERLVGPGQAKHLAILKRALGDDRRTVRLQALELFNRFRPTLQSDEVRAVLASLPHAPTAPREVQAYINALLHVDPAAAVNYVATHWDAFPSDRLRGTALRELSQVRGTKARHAALDLALRAAGPSQTSSAILRHALGVLKGHWDYRVADVTAVWKRMLDSPHLAREDVVRDFKVGPKFGGTVSDVTDVLLPAWEAWAQGPGEDDTSHDDHPQDDVDLSEGEDLLTALVHQPREKTHDIFMDVMLDPMRDEGMRGIAVATLLGRVTEDDRTRMAAWLGIGEADDTDPMWGRGRGEGESMQWLMAQVLGRGSSDERAMQALDTMRREIHTFWTEDRWGQLATRGPQAVRQGAYEGRIRILARCVAEARRPKVMRHLVGMLFDPAFLRYCRICARRTSTSRMASGPASSARPPADLFVLAFRADSEASMVFPREPFELASQSKVLKDEVTATLLESVLTTLQRSGRLADFPDVYLSRLRGVFRHQGTGRKVRTTQVITRFMKHTLPLDSALDYYAWVEQTSDLGNVLNFQQAAATQDEAVGLLRRRNLHVSTHDMLARAQVTAMALQGAAHAKAGNHAEARAAFEQALALQPHDASAWNTVAWYQALADFDLETAHTRAARAATLERRASGRVTLNTADTWATVYLKRGMPNKGLALVSDRVPRATDLVGGNYHLLLARLYASAHQRGPARTNLRKAFIRDRTLLARAKADPFLAELEQAGLIDKEAARAEQERPLSDE